jgi:hypothetical protein
MFSRFVFRGQECIEIPILITVSVSYQVFAFSPGMNPSTVKSIHFDLANFHLHLCSWGWGLQFDFVPTVMDS